MRLYCIRINRGSQNPEYTAFHKAMSQMNGKHPDYGGSMNGALVMHHMDENIVKSIITEEIKNTEDVRIVEVTNKTLAGDLLGYVELVERYFIPYDEYPNISV